MWKIKGAPILCMWKLEGAAPHCRRVLYFVLVFECLFSFCSVKGQSSDFGEDYECLVSFKSRVDDPQSLLSSWKASDMHRGPPCNGSISSWNGVTCDNNRVFSLVLPNSGLNGAISPNISKCGALNTLDLSANHLTGEIPSKFGELSNLVSLNLSQNDLTGEIPAQLASCSYLNVIDLHANALQGPIPVELGNLERLQEFDVSENGLKGQIPAGLAYNGGGGARFNASSYEGNRDLYGFPLPSENGHPLSLLEIIGIGLASGVFSLTLSFTAVCLWLKISEQRRAAEEGRISDLIAEA